MIDWPYLLFRWLRPLLNPSQWLPATPITSPFSSSIWEGQNINELVPYSTWYSLPLPPWYRTVHGTPFLYLIQIHFSDHIGQDKSRDQNTVLWILTFWYGSGSSYFRHWLYGNKKLFSKFFCFLFLEGTFTSFFSKIKVIKKSQTSRNQGFLTIFA